MTKSLFLNSDLCTGCLNCQAACALERGGGAGASLSGLRIGFDPFGGPHLLSVCRQCEDAAPAVCMDNVRDMNHLNRLWNEGNAFWKKW